MKHTKKVILLLIVLSFAVSFYFYPRLPERVASHWNAAGVVDGYMSRFWGAFLMPVVISAMAMLFLLLPKIDPLKANYEKFRRYFDGFIILIMLFMGYIHGLSIAWNLGIYFNFSFAMLPPMAILFYGVGVLTQNAKRNWFVGIRTPWTLSSDEIWDKTHQLGGRRQAVQSGGGLLSARAFFRPIRIILFRHSDLRGRHVHRRLFILSFPQAE
jgi:uncharacterized membrane protein